MLASILLSSMMERVCCGYRHMGNRWVIGRTDQLQFCWVHHSMHLFQHTSRHNESLYDQTHNSPLWVLIQSDDKKKGKCVWSPMSTGSNHSNKLNILKRFLGVFSFNCMGVQLYEDMGAAVRLFHICVQPITGCWVSFPPQILCPCGHLAHRVL